MDTREEPAPRVEGTMTKDMDGRFWLREIGLCAGLAVLLVLDITALGCAGGTIALDQMALHLWGPGG